MQEIKDISYRLLRLNCLPFLFPRCFTSETNGNERNAGSTDLKKAYTGLALLNCQKRFCIEDYFAV